MKFHVGSMELVSGIIFEVLQVVLSLVQGWIRILVIAAGSTLLLAASFLLDYFVLDRCSNGKQRGLSSMLICVLLVGLQELTNGR